MTTSKPTELHAPSEIGSGSYSPKVEADPAYGGSAKPTDPSSLGPNATEPTVSAPAGQGTSLTGPWQVNPADPRLQVGTEEINQLLSEALVLANQYTLISNPDGLLTIAPDFPEISSTDSNYQSSPLVADPALASNTDQVANHGPPLSTVGSSVAYPLYPGNVDSGETRSQELPNWFSPPTQLPSWDYSPSQPPTDQNPGITTSAPAVSQLPFIANPAVTGGSIGSLPQVPEVSSLSAPLTLPTNHGDSEELPNWFSPPTQLPSWDYTPTQPPIDQNPGIPTTAPAVSQLPFIANPAVTDGSIGSLPQVPEASYLTNPLAWPSNHGDSEDLPNWLSSPNQLPPWALTSFTEDNPKSPKSDNYSCETSPAPKENEDGLSPADPVQDSSHDFSYDFKTTTSLAPPAYVGPIAVSRIRDDFPILKTTVEGGQPLIWFDNAATTQKPQAVIDRLVRYYREENSNIHRGAHTLAAKATEAYEEARRKVAAFIGAPGPDNIVFVRGTTEGINLIAQAFVAPRLNPGDEIILTELEHHANIVPWQIVAQQKKAYIKVLPIDDQGHLVLSKLPGLFSPKTKVLALTQVSNALGTVTEVSEIIALSKAQGVPVVVDAAQSIAHLPIDVKTLGVDFLVFSGHKIYGPTGIGVVYGTKEALAEASPYQGGGNMISDVTFERTLYREPPVKFEAGTQNIAGAVGLGAALDYVGALGLDRIALYEEALLHYLVDRLQTVPGLKIIGNPAKRAGVVSFVLANRSVPEVGSHLAKYGVAVRAGHHCAQPAVRHFGLEGTVRPSPSFYNTPDEVDRMVEILGLLV
jgi:cysteine desulfurase/selenocysteine lyase